MGEVEQIQAEAAKAESKRQALQRTLDSVQQAYSLYTTSIQLLFDTLYLSVAKSNDAVTTTCTDLPSVESIVASNCHCHMTTILVASPPALTYSCDVDRNGDDSPYLRVRCELPNETVEIFLQRWDANQGRTGFYHSGYGHSDQLPLDQIAAAVATNVHRLVGYTAKKSGYLGN